MKRTIKRGLALILMLALIAALGACGKKQAPQEEPSGSAAAPVSAVLYGTPWVNSIVDGNLPAQAPEAKDDIYLHYNFDELQAKQGTFILLC